MIEDAENDLLDIYAYIAAHDSVEKGLYVVDKLEAYATHSPSFPFDAGQEQGEKGANASSGPPQKGG